MCVCVSVLSRALGSKKLYIPILMCDDAVE